MTTSPSPSFHQDHDANLIASCRVWVSGEIRKDPPAAIAAMEPILAYAESAGRPHVRAYAQLVIGAAQAILGQVATADVTLRETRDYFHAIGDDWGYCHAILNRSLVSITEDDPSDALIELPVALERARRLNDPLLVSSLLNDLGVAYRFDHQIEESVTCLIESIAISGAEQLEMQHIIGRINLAETYCRQHDWEAGHEEATWCMEFCATHPDYAHFDAYCAYHLALCEAEFGNTDRALELLEHAHQRSIRNREPVRIAVSSFAEGRIRAGIGDTDGAIAAFTRAREAWAGIEAEHPGLLDLHARWWIESLRHAWTWETVIAIRDGLDRAPDHPDDTVTQLHVALAESCEQLGDIPAALAYERQARQLGEQYWKEVAARQSHLAAKLHQTDVARQIAERERAQHEDLRTALDNVVQLNRQNEELVAQLTAKSRELEDLASRDALTQLSNRGHLDQVLQRELVIAGEQQSTLSLLMVDVDDFKRINDQHTHRVGDAVLRAMATIFRQEVHGRNFVARYGGEEFAFILVDADDVAATTFAQRLAAVTAAYSWDQLAPGIVVTLSIGIATVTGEATPDAILNLADALLYEAKQAGKNRIRKQRLVPLANER